MFASKRRKTKRRIATVNFERRRGEPHEVFYNHHDSCPNQWRRIKLCKGS